MKLLLALLVSSPLFAQVYVAQPPHLTLTTDPHSSDLWLRWQGTANIRYSLCYSYEATGPWTWFITRSAMGDIGFITCVPFSPAVVSNMFFRMDLQPPGGRGRVCIARPLSQILADYSDMDASFLFSLLPSDHPMYQSSCLETQVFEGTITVSNDCRLLYIRSDDGSSVTVNGVTLHNAFGLNQSWPQGFHYVGKLTTGNNLVQVAYANTIHTASDPDDGVTLFLVGGGYGENHCLRGTNVLWWYGEDKTWTYGLNRATRTLLWTASPHLAITSTNDTCQSITVQPLAHSVAKCGDWVQAVWTDECSGLVCTSKLCLTILRPRDEQVLVSTMGFMTYQGKSYFALSNSIQILDQFQEAWTNDCYVSSDSFVVAPQPLPSGVSIIADFTNAPAAYGQFSEVLGIVVGLSTGVIDVDQNRAVRAHLPNIFGSAIDTAKIRYHREPLPDQDTILVQNVQ